MLCDLHVHTDFSDSSLSPEEVVEIASESEIAAVGITDHDATGGIEPAIEAARERGVEIVPGVELTADTYREEIHVLGYFVDWQDSKFQKLLESLRENRLWRLGKILKKLSTLGVKMTAGDVIEFAGRGSVGRLHIAKAIHKKGHVSSINEAFKRYIGTGGPAYVKRNALKPREAIEAIIKVGGIPVLAHPATIGDDSLIPAYAKHGLRGIEVYHTNHCTEDEKRYETMAKDLGLLITGGSDCHGDAKGEILLGKVVVPYRILETLKREKYPEGAMGTDTWRGLTPFTEL